MDVSFLYSVTNSNPILLSCSDEVWALTFKLYLDMEAVCGQMRVVTNGHTFNVQVVDPFSPEMRTVVSQMNVDCLGLKDL